MMRRVFGPGFPYFVRYGLVAVLFGVAGLARSIGTPIPGAISPSLLAVGGSWTALNTEHSAHVFSGGQSCPAGKPCRLTFEAYRHEVNSLGKEESGQSQLSIYAQSNSGDKVLVRTETVADSADAPHDIVFTPSVATDQLLFQKTEPGRSSVQVRNVFLTSLNVQTEADASSLKPSVIGAVTRPVIDSQGMALTDSLVSRGRLWKRGDRIGQVFQAKDTVLSGVDFQIQPYGNGGNGVYQVQLVEVSKTASGYSAVSPVLTGLDFRASDASFYRTSKNGPWHFPLTSFLEKGKYYFVGISNTAALTNYFNGLELLGPASGGSQLGSGWNLGNGTSIGALSFAAYGETSFSGGDTHILQGSLLEDIGKGEGLYRYRSSGVPEDLLDLDYASVISARAKGQTFFDTSKGAVVATAANDMTMTYRVDMGHAITQALVQADGVSGYVRSTLSYSLDGVSWKAIQYAPQQAGHEFERQIAGDGVSHTLYLRVGYDPAHLSDTKSQVFGLSTLSISARLNIQP